MVLGALQWLMLSQTTQYVSTEGWVHGSYVGNVEGGTLGTGVGAKEGLSLGTNVGAAVGAGARLLVQTIFLSCNTQFQRHILALILRQYKCELRHSHTNRLLRDKLCRCSKFH